MHNYIILYNSYFLIYAFCVRVKPQSCTQIAPLKEPPLVANKGKWTEQHIQYKVPEIALDLLSRHLVYPVYRHGMLLRQLISPAASRYKVSGRKEEECVKPFLEQISCSWGGQVLIYHVMLILSWIWEATCHLLTARKSQPCPAGGLVMTQGVRGGEICIRLPAYNIVPSLWSQASASMLMIDTGEYAISM